MKTEILSEELNSMKYLLGYKRGMVISEQAAPTTGTTAAPVTAAPVTAAPVTAAPVTAAPTTGTTAAPVTAAPTTGTTVAAAPATPATNVSMPDLIKQVQTILKTKFNATLGNTGPNKDGIDGVWGKNSQTAFENALKTLSTQTASAAPTTGTTTVVAGAPAAGTGTPPAAGAPVTQQKFNFNPNNFNPESGINFKPSTPKLQ
jgi:hypothetical protein